MGTVYTLGSTRVKHAEKERGRNRLPGSQNERSDCERRKGNPRNLCGEDLEALGQLGAQLGGQTRGAGGRAPAWRPGPAPAAPALPAALAPLGP